MRRQFFGIMPQMLTQAPTARQNTTNDQIKELPRKVSDEFDQVHQQKQNKEYISTHIAATSTYNSHSSSYAVSLLADIFLVINKPYADHMNKILKDWNTELITPE